VQIGKKQFLNVGCGDIFIDSPEWINIDWAPKNRKIIKANLLQPLKFPSQSFDLIYTSHFVEHISRDKLNAFLTEMKRLLKDGGILRIAAPDFEYLTRKYINLIDSSEYEKSQFITAQILDQCVRKRSGGSIPDWYSRASKNPELLKFIKEVNGHRFNPRVISVNSGTLLLEKMLDFRKVFGKLRKIYIESVLKLLPDSFVETQVSLTEPGENHAWVYDFFYLRNNLQEAGFSSVMKMSASTSNLIDFPYKSLDTDSLEIPIKGKETMFIEAIR